MTGRSAPPGSRRTAVRGGRRPGPAPQPDVTAGVAYLFARRPPVCGGMRPRPGRLGLSGQPAAGAVRTWSPGRPHHRPLAGPA